MIVAIAILLALLPALFILWPFVAGLRRDEFEYDEGAPQADLMRRWDATVAGLASTELDHALGNLTGEDYRGLRTQLMSEAADLMREMELSEDEEERMLTALGEELLAVRSRIEGESDNTHGGDESADDSSFTRPARSPEPGQ